MLVAGATGGVGQLATAKLLEVCVCVFGASDKGSLDPAQPAQRHPTEQSQAQQQRLTIAHA